jgi:hypothetical protein
MSILGVTTAASTVMLTAAMTLAAPASASPDNPCGATLIPICAFVPVLPGLDEVVPGLVEVEVAVPRSRPAVW